MGRCIEHLTVLINSKARTVIVEMFMIMVTMMMMIILMTTMRRVRVYSSILSSLQITEQYSVHVHTVQYSLYNVDV